MALNSTIICFIITVLCLGGISVFIAWISDKMKSPTFTLDHTSINGYNFTRDNHLSAAFLITVRSHNRDSKYKIDYSVIVVSVYHSGYTLAYDTLGPYTQPHGEDIVFTARPTARNVSIMGPGLAGDIRNETGSGRLGVEVRVRAAVKYEVRGWKHKSYAFYIVCPPLFINLSSTGNDDRTECDVDRF